MRLSDGTRAGVRLSVHTIPAGQSISNFIWSIIGVGVTGGLTAFDFGPDQIRTLVSMATNSSHRVIMGKIL